MAEYLERETLLKSLTQECKDCDNNFGYDCEECDYAHAILYVKAERAADVQPVKWISVNDRLPDEGERVLIYAPKTQNQYYVAMFYMLHGEIKFTISIYGMSYCWYAEDVTHWQPLPKPPKDGEQNDD